jgi:hypothetical protein
MPNPAGDRDGPRMSPRRRTGQTDPSRPFVLESVPGRDTNDGLNPDAPRSGREPFPSESVPPQRRSGFFGRLFPPLSIGRGSGGPDDAISVEPRTDPASDAALKRRLEHQIRTSLGDRVRFVEVRVVGRDVSVVARASRFWQRRSVRRSIESLPLLSGVRSRVEVD